nr:potassium channel subfamily K 8 [Hymenolepis microstoma]
MGCCSDYCNCCCSAKTQAENNENDSYYEVASQRSGLSIIITLYLIGGAYLFNYLEREPHQKRLNDSLKVLQTSYDHLTDSMKRFKRSTSDNIQPKARHIGHRCIDYQIEALHREIERLQQVIHHEHLMSRKTEIQRLRLKINELMSSGEIKLLNEVLNHSFQIDLPAQIRSYKNILNPGRHIDEAADLNYDTKLHHFVMKIYEAVQAGWVIPSLERDVETVPVSQSDKARIAPSDEEVMELSNRTPRTDPWTKTGSLFYVITVITTIGYGEVVPVTKYGRLATIFYGLFGIPMMLLFLTNLGSLMADVFRILYKRLCCCCIKKRKPSLSAPTDSTSVQRSLNSSSHGKQSITSQASLIRPTPGRSQKASVLHELVNRTAAPLPGVTESIFVSLAGPHSIFARAIQARKESRNVQSLLIREFCGGLCYKV